MVTATTLATNKLLEDFLADCKARELSAETVRGYGNYLRHFAAENPELPRQPEIIEKWLLARGESFNKRGNVFRRVQAFYDYLVRAGVLQVNPIPRAKMGRPSKPPQPKRPRGRPRKNEDKVVGGGVRSFTVNLTVRGIIRPDGTISITI